MSLRNKVGKQIRKAGFYMKVRIFTQVGIALLVMIFCIGTYN